MRTKLLASVFSAFILVLLVAAEGSAQAVDPDVRFVEALRARGYHDLAIDYLESASKGSAVTPALKKRLAYELAVTRLDSARRLANGARRDEALIQAQRDLERFIQSAKDQSLVAEGTGRLASALSDQGYRLVAELKKLGNKKDERTKKQRDARKAYDTARQLYTKASKAYETALEDYKAVKPGSPRAMERLTLRSEMARMQVLAARVLHDKAKSYDKRSKVFKQLNTQAAKELLTTYDKYAEQAIGMYAHLWEGHCYQATGEHKLAKGCFEELIFQAPNQPVFRTIITLAHAGLVESRLAEGEVDKAIDEGTRWLGDLKNAEQNGTAAAILKYQLGVATMRVAKDADGSNGTRLLTRARGYFRDASRVAGEYQASARSKLAEVTEKLGAETPEPTNFAEAYQVGRDAVASMQAAKLAAKVAKDNNPSSAASLEADVVSARQEAMEAFYAALELVDSDTEIATLNDARYLLGYLHWEQQDYQRAAVIGRFVAMSYPDSSSAEKSASLAMDALKRLYNDALTTSASEAGDFESQQLKQLAIFVTKRWKGAPIAEAAYNDLMSLALRSGDIGVARDVVAQAPEERRAALSLKLASALWEQASRASAKAGDDLAARRAAQRQKDDALQMFRESFPAAQKMNTVTSETATAGLYYAQALLESGDAAGAVKLLQDKKVGAVTLVDKKAKAVARRGFAAEAYKTALRAFVAVNPPQTDNAVKMMDRLEQVSGGKSANLTAVYFSLGVQLQRQITDLKASGKHVAAKQLVKAFAVFLERLSERLGDADWVSQQWIGQTYIGLGEGLAGGGDEKSRREYYERAASTFQAMIDRASTEPNFAPSPNSVLAARIQLGKAQRQVGAYQEAIDTFSGVLVTRPTLLDVQKEAAITYMDWGGEDPEQFLNAIRGGRLDPETNKNLIWGWSKLSKFAARAARSDEKYKDLFFECWLNIAKSRFLAAEKASGEKRLKNLASARKTFRSIYSQYPELGGPRRSQDFDRLLKEIQQLEGKEPIGLEELSS